jgi:hypothetical protein
MCHTWSNLTWFRLPPVFFFSYAATLASVNMAFSRFKTLGVPHERPADYYAETVKTDEHMLKLKDSLLADMRRLGEKQEKIKQKLAKKYAKQVRVSVPASVLGPKGFPYCVLG